jgi:hypothetical protein
MGKKITFTGTEGSKTENHHLTAYVNANDELFISIVDTKHIDDIYYQQNICLDKETTIELIKELENQIKLIEQLEELINRNKD